MNAKNFRSTNASSAGAEKTSNFLFMRPWWQKHPSPRELPPPTESEDVDTQLESYLMTGSAEGKETTKPPFLLPWWLEHPSSSELPALTESETADTQLEGDLKISH